jgi:hypothetical protein
MATTRKTEAGIRVAIIKPDGTIRNITGGYRIGGRVRPGYKVLPCPHVPKPTFDKTTHYLTGPDYTITETEVTESWNVVAYTPEELDTIKTNEVERKDRVFLRLLFNQENRLRVLEGKPELALAEYKTIVKGLL